MKQPKLGVHNSWGDLRSGFFIVERFDWLPRWRPATGTDGDREPMHFGPSTNTNWLVENGGRDEKPNHPDNEPEETTSASRSTAVFPGAHHLTRIQRTKWHGEAPLLLGRYPNSKSTENGGRSMSKPRNRNDIADRFEARQLPHPPRLWPRPGYC